MVKIYISIGSNLSPQANITQSIKALKKAFGDVEISPIYRSTAVGFDGPDFLNLVVAAETQSPIEDIEEILLAIETEQGRDRTQPRFSSRTLDLDLLLYGNKIISQDGITVPRAEIEEHVFVLQPLADLAGEQKHPRLGVSYNQMLKELLQQTPGLSAQLTRVSLPLQ